MNIFIEMLLMVLGFVLLVKGADYFVDGASGIAGALGIPELVIGMTVVAMGTSSPEAAVSIAAAIKGNADISIGNVLGSNIINILVILGATALIIPIATAHSTVKYEIPFMIAVSVLFVVMGRDGSISRLDGIILVLLLAVYLGYMIYMSMKGEPKKSSKAEKKERPMWKQIFFAAAGLVAIIWGSNIAVEAASTIARIFGMSERFIGLTIVALGTSLPELFTSVMAARKGNADIAIGNIVGSNIINILFVIGVSSCIVPLRFAAEFREDSIIAIICSIVLFLCVVMDKKLGRDDGGILLLGYSAYFIRLLIEL